jgi:tRNA dimethylallyltransferase
MGTPQAIVIAGPTASGKSALATTLAQRLGGVVVNADSMQVYRELRILTARPTPDDEALVPHRLYGHVAAVDPYSVGHFITDVQTELDAARAAGLLPIIVGGTGLYLKALFDGLSPIPAVDPDVRARWRGASEDAAPGALHLALAHRDPVMAGRLAPGDTQRIVRALEVIESTGRSLAHWQAERGVPLLEAEQCARLVLAPQRQDLYARVDARFEAMVRAGAVDEVARLAALELPATLPAMRAVGVPPLLRHVAGSLPLADAVALGQQDTRNYVKRQSTWLRRYMIAWKWIYSQFSERNADVIGNLFDLRLT